MFHVFSPIRTSKFFMGSMEKMGEITAMAMPRYDYCDPQILGWAETSVKSPDQVLPGDWHFPAEAPRKTWGFRQGKSMGCKEGSHLHGKLGCNLRMPKK